MNDTNTKKEVMTHNYFLIGATSSMVSKMSVSPLDRLKFLTQTKSNSEFTGLVSDIFKKEGLSGFYKGVFPILATSIPKSAIYFTALNTIKTHMNNYSNNGQCLSSHKINFFSGLSAGIITTTLLYPTDVISSKYYYDIGNNQSLLKITKNTFLEKKMFRGYSATLMGTVPNHGLSYLLYTSIKDSNIISSKFNDIIPTKIISMGDNGNTFVSSYIASISTQLAAYPFDTIRKKMQVGDLNFIDTVKQIKNGSLLDFYRGFKISIIKTPLSNAIYFMCAEFLIRQNVM
ncbi:MAG: hypothetical protein Terrestrivirus5_45 [Terrestrivirus sp.]|uniref:Mitochondrial carrier protein n=1 Tax=Terrestrivirus sp. TaxID=2487775 RepID=A0A3G4ZRJ8_9VIRU|nr:MAG: hypothetical protein Terrestrivirus5_45 [Terrestrivirus sp.]